jgi:hypothetical protein
MNKGVKIGLITFGAAVVAYGTFKVIQLNRIKKSVENYQGDTEKIALIYQICIQKGIPFEQNKDQYLRYSVEELNSMLDNNEESEMPDNYYGNTIGSEYEYGYYSSEY